MDKLYRKLAKGAENRIWNESDRQGYNHPSQSAISSYALAELQEFVTPSMLEKGIQDYFEAHTMSPVVESGWREPPSVQNPETWKESVEIFCDVYGIGKNPKTARKAAEERGLEYGPATDRCRFVYEAIAKHIMPQLVRSGEYHTPWEDDTFVDLQGLQEYMGLPKFRSAISKLPMNQERLARDCELRAMTPDRKEIDPEGTAVLFASYVRNPSFKTEAEELKRRRQELSVLEEQLLRDQNEYRYRFNR